MGRFRDPADYPASSVATWSTHDTAPITAWWDELDDNSRAELSRLAGLDHASAQSADARWLPLMRLLYTSGSDVTLVLPQEILGERTRINTPGTVDERNWTYRLPGTLEDLSADPAVAARMRALAGLVRDGGR
jgi:4-alpha-glucanotransferase